MKTRSQKIAYAILLVTLLVAVFGGIALIISQLFGLVFGVEALLTLPNGVFKTTLCIAASVSALAVYFLLYIKPIPAQEER